jgi:FAD/FMN-containing dehydrogenase
MRIKFTWRLFFYALLLIILIIVFRPAAFLISTYFKDKQPAYREQKGYSNDASQLNNTQVYRIPVKNDVDQAIAQIAELIKSARNTGRKISIAGAQHTMGGHTIYPDGILLDMKAMNHLHVDTVNNVLTAGSGATWAEVIPYLDKSGKSVAIMQSNNSFTVGGSISANCHGWSPNLPPIVSSLVSFRMINAEGKLVRCSRLENAELFSLVPGGYGLFGVIIDAQLSITDNINYSPTQYIIPAESYVTRFRQLVRGRREIGMAYGRINVTPDVFMEEAILSVYRKVDSPETVPLAKTGYRSLRRIVFRGSVNSRYGKRLRWKAEKAASRVINRKLFSRNQLLNEGVEVFQNTDPGTTDILQEYFIPIDSATKFIRLLKQIIPTYQVDLLNITLRDVRKDSDSFLSYANEDVIGFVMLFNQRRDTAAEQEMQRLTVTLIDTAYPLGGTYYLPYRLHASREQFRKVYPESEVFFSMKRKYDPQGIFQNKFYQAYR